VQDHFDFVWRSLRRLGVASRQVDDACQRVWLVVARKLASIAVGQERAFLFGTALRVASDDRRAARRRPEDLSPSDALFDPIDDGPRPDEALEQARARAELDAVLGELPLDLRAVFVLFELEELSSPEIAAMLDLPLGTVASRLRRAREAFTEIAQRRRARARSGVGR
jgi:RNA polymerase sigma-70 factor (ECF subfamily)